MSDAVEPEKSERPKKVNWWWAAEVLASALAGAVGVAFRGCLHGRLSWPVAVRGYSYRVCLSCGAKRLFDEKTFTGYGPYRYDLNESITPEKSVGQESPVEESPAMENLQHPSL